MLGSQRKRQLVEKLALAKQHTAHTAWDSEAAFQPGTNKPQGKEDTGRDEGWRSGPGCSFPHSKK